MPKRSPSARPPRAISRGFVFIATSLDGFIARENGDLDWLPEAGGADEEDYGYRSFLERVDALVMGRATFEKVLTFGDWPYGEKPVVVLTRRPLPIPAQLKGCVEAMSGRPSTVATRLARRGLRRLYVDGGRTIQGFLTAGLIDEITITRVPVLLGRGIPLFRAMPRDVSLRHLGTKHFDGGLVQSTYRVDRDHGPPSRRR